MCCNSSGIPAFAANTDQLPVMLPMIGGSAGQWFPERLCSRNASIVCLCGAMHGSTRLGGIAVRMRTAAWLRMPADGSHACRVVQPLRCSTRSIRC